MKNILFLFAFLFCLTTSEAQIKVYSNGDVFAGAVAPSSSPNADLQVGGLLTSEAFYAGPVVGPFAPGRFSLSGNSAEISIVDRQVNSFVTFPTNGERYAIYNNNGVLAFWSSANLLTLKKNGQLGVSMAPLNNHKLSVNGTAYKASGGSNWSIPSDKNLKSNISAFNDGLKYVLKMNPVEYEYNGKAGTIKGDFQLGVLAQELRDVAPFMVEEVTFDGEEYNPVTKVTTKSNRNETFLTVNPSAIKWMLVSAVKEQHSIIESQSDKISDLEYQIEKINESLSQLLESNNHDITLMGENKAILNQNIPNPFTDFTSIEYFIPVDAVKSSIKIYDTTGRFVKEVEISKTGKGILNINTQDLQTGSYVYQLIVDNEMIGSKKMVQTK